jgi:hypothetical protein
VIPWRLSCCKLYPNTLLFYLGLPQFSHMPQQIYQ